jgi:hypothetical protein
MFVRSSQAVRLNLMRENAKPKKEKKRKSKDEGPRWPEVGHRRFGVAALLVCGELRRECVQVVFEAVADG